MPRHQVLCPMNRGVVGARSLNADPQAALNPPGEARVERFGWTFSAGDRVMQIESDYDKEVYNGDIGYVEKVDVDEGELTVRFDRRSVAYGFGELDSLVPAYAVAIHKSQGSEYPAVVILVRRSTTRCCSGTCSTPASHAESGSWCSSVRRRRWRSL
jgi:exodeoxyribonuclease V alpha subunit